MRYVIVLLLLAAQISAFVVPASAGAAAAPRVVVGVDAKSSQRYVQLTARGGLSDGGRHVRRQPTDGHLDAIEQHR